MWSERERERERLGELSGSLLIEKLALSDAIN
jgi:hypothetical protein